MFCSRTACLFLACALCGGTSLSAARTQRSDVSAGNTRVEVYESSEDWHETLQPKPSLQFGPVRAPELTITVSDSRKYQEMDGFGASLTDSSAWLLWHSLTETQRRAVLEELFDPAKGIGLSILRQPMGASDFALQAYSYDVVSAGDTDPQLRRFSIGHDREYIIPILRDALALNPNLKIIASPWSPPGWMKTSGSMIQGSLLPSAYSPLADYFVKFIEAYGKAGVPIYAITPQNEPLNVPVNYPGMGMTAMEQRRFLKDSLGPAFHAAGLSTKILVFDHNWDLIAFPIQVLGDEQAALYSAGTAVHCYGGSVTAQVELHDRFPGKGIWLTECSGGGWQTGKILAQQVRLIIEATRNWAKSVVLWNLVLDQNHGPYLGGCTDCRGVVTINDQASPAQVTYTEDFTALAHASKFVMSGATRIESNTFGQGSLEDVAFQNPDGSIVLIVLNSGSASTVFNIAWSGEYATYKLRAGAVVTLRWPSRTRVSSGKASENTATTGIASSRGYQPPLQGNRVV